MGTAKTFPGVYTQVVDRSFVSAPRSRFQPGLIGVASKGPFDVATRIASLKDFVNIFGTPLTTTYSAGVGGEFGNTGDSGNAGEPIGPGFFLADAVGMLADMTDSITVVRVGNRYEDLPTEDGSGTSGSYTLVTSGTNASYIDSLLGDGDVFLSVTQEGKASTVNVQVDSVSGTLVNLLPTGSALAASYTAATIGYSQYSGAAFSAESTIYAYTYGTSASDPYDREITTLGTVTGEKNNYYFDITTNPNDLDIGGVYKIAQTNKATTSEVRISKIIGNRVYLETADLSRIGYQALPLQDNYTGASVFAVNTALKVPFLSVEAASPGTWANGSSATTGLYVRVRPGSGQGTKKLEVYWDSALVETLDNISDTTDTTAANSYESVIATSGYLRVRYRYSVGGGQKYHAANTVAPWDSNYYSGGYTPPGGQPISMPQGALNAGILSFAVNDARNTGAQFTNGFNGENAQPSDFIGSILPTDDTPTGLKCFEDTENVSINVLAAPMDDIDIGVMQEMRRVAQKVNAIAIADVPAGLSARQAIDWQNGAGVFSSRGRIDSPYIAIYWNWITITDPFSGNQKLVPPTLGALRCMAFTFDRDKPWYAAAGEQRGLIPEATNVEFERVPEEVRQAMQGNGSSVNPILKMRATGGRRIMLYGERTQQIAESKLSQVHAVILVNWVVSGLAQVGRRFVFEPNDNELLIHIQLAFTEFLDKIRNERGIEDYELIVDDRNNTADTRNRREVVVDLQIIPTDVAERIYINATVRESGAELNSVTA